MSKDSQTRLTDTLRYIRDNIGAHLADEIQQLIIGREDAISGDLALGTRWDLFSSNAQQQRHALRALLLCQRVYLSDLWRKYFGTTAALTGVDYRPNDWKEQSCQFWSNKSEQELRAALRMYVATMDNWTYAANSASNWIPSSPDSILIVTRETYTGNQLSNTCYNAVMLWLFKAGLVSFRWYLRYAGANTQHGLTEAFGQGSLLWNREFTDKDKLPAIARGSVVHIFENVGAWRGHWMISLGNGKAAGINNNNEAPPVPRGYCRALTLDKQFLDFNGGTAVVINPSTIPNRN